MLDHVAYKQLRVTAALAAEKLFLRHNPGRQTSLRMNFITFCLNSKNGAASPQKQTQVDEGMGKGGMTDAAHFIRHAAKMYFKSTEKYSYLFTMQLSLESPYSRIPNP